MFAYEFVVDKLKVYYETFYKLPVAKNYHQYGEVVGVATIAVN